MQEITKVPSNMFTVAPGVWGRKVVFVNYYIIQDLINDQWVLVDAGLKWSASNIKETAAYLFGSESIPAAIILTHGHFDHVGSVTKLADEWDVPVYAHHLEIPYLSGLSNYPPPDPTVGGGLMSAMSFLYPKTPVNAWRHLKVLPSDGKIPALPEWRYIHTPGHTAGHISLYRESDRVLIAGDAFVTTKAESLYSTIFQTKIVSGPPKYFTSDWEAAQLSVEKLVKLNPKTAATGHGRPMRGKDLQVALIILAEEFYQKTIPAKGRYFPHPAVANANGVIYTPPKKQKQNKMALKAFGVSALVALGIVWSSYKKKKKTIEIDSFLDVEYNY